MWALLATLHSTQLFLVDIRSLGPLLFLFQSLKRFHFLFGTLEAPGGSINPGQGVMGLRVGRIQGSSGIEFLDSFFVFLPLLESGPQLESGLRQIGVVTHRLS